MVPHPAATALLPVVSAVAAAEVAMVPPPAATELLPVVMVHLQAATVLLLAAAAVAAFPMAQQPRLMVEDSTLPPCCPLWLFPPLVCLVWPP